MSGADYGRSLSGFGINLLGREIAPAVAFHRAVLNANVVYEDPDFAVPRHGTSAMMLHSDHTYDHHPIRTRLGDKHGNGGELRLHHTDPDAAEARHDDECGSGALSSARADPSAAAIHRRL